MYVFFIDSDIINLGQRIWLDIFNDESRLLVVFFSLIFVKLKEKMLKLASRFVICGPRLKLPQAFHILHSRHLNVHSNGDY